MLDVWIISLQEGSRLLLVDICVKASVFVTFISIDVRLAEARVFTVVFGDCDSLTASHFSAFGLTFLEGREISTRRSDRLLKVSCSMRTTSISISVAIEPFVESPITMGLVGRRSAHHLIQYVNNTLLFVRVSVPKTDFVIRSPAFVPSFISSCIDFISTVFFPHLSFLCAYYSSINCNRIPTRS